MSTTQPIRRRTVKRWGPEKCPVCGAPEAWDGVRVTTYSETDEAGIRQITKRTCSCANCGARWETTRG